MIPVCIIPVFPIERDDQRGGWRVHDPDTGELLAWHRTLRHAEQTAILLSEEREAVGR